MPRNFHSRVEVMFPVEDPALRARVLDEVLGLALRDSAKARRLEPDGHYRRLLGEPGLRSQEALVEAARQAASAPARAVIRQIPALPETPGARG